MSTGSDMSTTRVVDDEKNPKLLRRKVRLEVLRGPDAGKHVAVGKEEINVGTLPANDLVLTDGAVSRYHLRISSGSRGFVIADHDSTNGTFIGTLRVREVTTNEAVDLQVGSSLIRLTPLSDEVEVPLHGSERFGKLLGKSPQMRAIFAELDPIAGSPATVLIEGETGTGKELLAEEIHRTSPRRDEPFVIVDCGAIPDTLIESELFGHVRGAFTGATGDRVGAFELAASGTLFLDEVGEMSGAAQPKLLRALESRQVKPVGSDRYRSTNARIIAATNRDLRAAVDAGLFREDLFYRLHVVVIHVPPLRERPEDLDPLIDHFLAKHGARFHLPACQLGPAARAALHARSYPGNVRELEHTIEQAVALSAGGLIESLDANATADDAPAELGLKERVEAFERGLIVQELARCGGNRSEAARRLGIGRVTLLDKLRKHGL
jgi:DNA-binding NtrC family response regulator